MIADDDREFIEALECPECGPLDPELLTQAEVDTIIGGDEYGFQRCPDCGEGLEPTLDAALDMLRLVAERRPDMAQGIANQVKNAVTNEEG